MSSTVLEQLRHSLRWVNCMYGPALRERNMREALDRAGVKVPDLHRLCASDTNGALAMLVWQEIDRRERRRDRRRELERSVRNMKPLFFKSN